VGAGQQQPRLQHGTKTRTERGIVEVATVVQVVAVELVDGLERLLVVGPDCERLAVEVVFFDVVGRLLEAVRAGEVQIGERLGPSLEVVVDAETLAVFLERLELLEERQILARVLCKGEDVSRLSRRRAPTR
jgi:hypothetical protein